jgi:hypothetical protein
MQFRVNDTDSRHFKRHRRWGLYAGLFDWWHQCGITSLHDRGVLTDGEFTSVKARVLATTSTRPGSVVLATQSAVTATAGTTTRFAASQNHTMGGKRGE